MASADHRRTAAHILLKVTLTALQPSFNTHTFCIFCPDLPPDFRFFLDLR